MTSNLGHTGGGRDRWSDRLSEYLDGDLKPAERAQLEEHLVTCESCTTALAELSQVVERAHMLEDAPPERDLWPGIEAKLEPRNRSVRVRRERPEVIDIGAWWTRRFELGVPQLAAAGLILIALSAAGVWVALNGVSP
ncbi:MAG TPA: zf-HC2 domain-containing protein, partial [Candidatus Eisenbacteria bacterium]|nr:zf-HC2 domain-containing protein [Candidatus Eisenbacteria bacterium]